MGQLSKRHCSKLLRKVGNRQHASIDDHEDDIVLSAAPVIVKKVETSSDFVVRSIEKVDTSSCRPLPQLLSKVAKTDLELPKPKRKQTEVIELLDSPPKRFKTSTKDIARAQSKAERSLPSPAQTESVKSWSGRKETMQTEVDFDADPLSSSDLEQALNTAAPKGSSKGSTDTRRSDGGVVKSDIEKKQASKNGRGARAVEGSDAQNKAGFRVVEKLHLATPRDNKTARKPTFKEAPSLPKVLGDEQLDDSSDGEIFSSQPPRKKQRQGAKTFRSSQQSVGYGKKAHRPLKVQTASFKKVAEPSLRPTEPERTFRRTDINDGRPSRVNAASSITADAEELPDASGMLPTELHEDEQAVDDGKIECKICNERLRRALQEQFEDEILKDKSWSFKWQGRFCAWHKTKTAHETWQARGYPDIDWNILRERMRKHDKFLLNVLHDQIASYHRDKLRGESKHGRSRQKDTVTGGNSKFIMGYYGQRGERQVHEYIMTRFADALRKRSTRDKLMLATGIHGGVNGFVQLVLAPHLAELLVKEDLNLSGADWEVRAREALAESAEIGELLFPEEQDKVEDNAYQDHIIEEDIDDRLLDFANDDAGIEVVELD